MGSWDKWVPWIDKSQCSDYERGNRTGGGKVLIRKILF